MLTHDVNLFVPKQYENRTLAGNADVISTVTEKRIG